MKEAYYIYEKSLDLLKYEFTLRNDLEHRSKHSNIKITRCVRFI